MDRKSSSERLADAVARARHHWQARRKAEAAAPISRTPAPAACSIAISREAGANGPQIARAVGEQLGWPVYDYELVQQIAGQMGLRTDLLKSVDEKHRNWLQDSLEQFLGVPRVSESAYVGQLVETLLALAAHGDCVLVGRGAAQVLPMATTLRVRLVGPTEARVKTIAQRFGITHDEAARWVERTDRERTQFVQDHFYKDPNDARLYDLVLNSSRFSVSDCADLIRDALHRLQTQARSAAP